METAFPPAPSPNGTASAHAEVASVEAPKESTSAESDAESTRADELRKRKNAVVQSAASDLEPEWLVKRMRANCSMCGFSITDVDPTPFQIVAGEVYAELARSADLTAEHAELNKLLGELTPGSLASQTRNALKNPALNALPDGANRQALELREKALRELAGGAAPAGGPIGQRVQAVLGAVEVVFEKVLDKAPGEVQGLVAQAVATVNAATTLPGSAADAVDTFAAMVDRFREFEVHRDQVNDRARKKVVSRYTAELRRTAAAAANAVVESQCAAELLRQAPAAVARYARQIRAASDRLKFQNEVKARLSAASGTAHSWTVALPTQDTREVRQVVLATRGARDAVDLAIAYRGLLRRVAPATQAEAMALAELLVDLVRSDAGAESDFALIGTEAAARSLAVALYRRAHPHGAIRFADPRLQCDVYELLALELPLCPPGLEAVRDALVDELHKVSGKTVGVMNLPPGVTGLKLYREVGGVYTVNLQVLKFLRAAYEQVQEFMPHDPHPVWSELVEARGFLNLGDAK